MNSAKQKTAKIYAFPVRPLTRSSADRLARLEQEARAYGKVEFGCGWYHDDAIVNAGSKRNH